MKHSYLGLAAFIAVLLYIINVFIHAEILSGVYSSISIILLVSAWLKMDKGNQLVVALLFIIGSALFLYYHAPFSEVLFSFGKNLNLLALFLLIPLFGTFMSEAGFLQNLQWILRKREERRQSHPYRLGFILTASMGWLLNLGSMPLVYKIGSESFTAFENKRLGIMILRGFGFCMLWSPYFVNVGLILILYDLTWGEIGGYGIILSSVYTVLVLCFFPFTRFTNEDVIQNDLCNERDNDSAHSVSALLLYILLLLILSFILESLLPANMLTIVSILAVIYPVIWSLCIQRFRSYIHEAAEYVRTSFSRVYNEMGIFITAGFFGEALARSETGDWLSAIILKLSHGIVPLLILFLIGSVMILALLGIHPVIIVLGLGSSLSPEAFGVTPAFMGLLLLCAWTLATQMTPFSGSVLMASHLMNEKPIHVMKKNAIFILTVLMVFTGLLTLFNNILE